MARNFDISPAAKRSQPAKTASRQRSGGTQNQTSSSRGVRFRPAGPSVEERKRVPGGIIPLKTKRRARRKKFTIVICILVLAFVALALVALWQPQVRIFRVEANGARAEAVPQYVQGLLEGTMYGVIPRDSVLFVPREEIRAGILRTFPDIEAVSISPSSLTSLSVSAIERARSFWWCGQQYSESPPVCFDTDATGRIFRTVELQGGASSSPSRISSSTPFIVYGAYEGGGEDNALGGNVVGAGYLPDMFRFVKALKELNANVTSALIRGDEADLYTASGTRITYVLGHEQEALTLAATAFPSLDIAGESLLYVDLRFTSKVYFKKKGSSQ